MGSRGDKKQRKQLWQKRRSPINGIGLFAGLPIRTGTPIIEFKGRVIPWEEGAVILLRGAKHVIKFDAKHDMDARPQWSPAGHVLIDYDFDLGEEFEPCRCGHRHCRGLMLTRKVPHSAACPIVSRDRAAILMPVANITPTADPQGSATAALDYAWANRRRYIL